MGGLATGEFEPHFREKCFIKRILRSCNQHVEFRFKFWDLFSSENVDRPQGSGAHAAHPRGSRIQRIGRQIDSNLGGKTERINPFAAWWSGMTDVITTKEDQD